MEDLTKEVIEAYVDTGEPMLLYTLFHEDTEVFVGDLTKELIEANVDTGKPM